MYDCSPELSREPPWQMPHVPWAMELAGYVTWRDSGDSPLMGDQKRGGQSIRIQLNINRGILTWRDSGDSPLMETRSAAVSRLESTSLSSFDFLLG